MTKEGDGEAEGVFAVEEHVQEQEHQAGKEFYGAGEHVGGDEFFAVLTVVAAEDDVHGEEGHHKEEEHDEGQRGGGELRPDPLEQQCQRGDDDRKHDDSERELLNRYLFAHFFASFGFSLWIG